MVGLDMMHERSDYERRTVSRSAHFDADNPDLHSNSKERLATKSHQITDTQYMGVYLRNNFKIDDHWIIGLLGSS